MIRLIGLVAGVVVIATPATAQTAWPFSEFSNGNKVHKVHRKVKRKTKRRRRPQVRSYVRRQKPNPNGTICAREFMVTGQVKASKERAQRSAWSAFHGEVKFALGERYADDRFARKPRFECARSKSETLTSKTVEAVGIGGGVYRFRCRLRAVACKPPVTD